MYENSITVKCISKMRSSFFQNVLTSKDGDIIRVHINISRMFEQDLFLLSGLQTEERLSEKVLANKRQISNM